MEAGSILPQWSDFFSLSSLLPAPLLPTCSSVVSIHALHEPHTFLVCLDGDSSSNLRHPILVTPWLWPPPSRHADVSVHRFLRVLTAQWGFLPLADPNCRGWEPLSVLGGKCYAQLLPGGECHAYVPESGGQIPLADQFTLQNYYSTQHPGNRMEQVDLPVTFHAMNFDSRAHRNRTRKDKENIHLIYFGDQSHF